MRRGQGLYCSQSMSRAASQLQEWKPVGVGFFVLSEKIYDITP